MAVKNKEQTLQLYLQKAISDIYYDDLPKEWKWSNDEMKSFSEDKMLYVHQKDALKSLIKVLYMYYTEDKKAQRPQGNVLYDACLDKAKMSEADFHIQSKEDKVYKVYIDNGYKASYGDKGKAYIHVQQMFNRACVWMATGSGKSLVIIKAIALIDKLMKDGLLPSVGYNIMLLLPNEGLIKQTEKQISAYNAGSDQKILLHEIKRFNEIKAQGSLGIPVFYGRSDLLTAQKKDKQLNYRDYLNHGKWYIFMDEAHRGDSSDSLLKAYVSAICKRGFLFNFSATFTEDLDYATTCYDFSLHKFVQAGYGKKVYVSPSTFYFAQRDNDLDDSAKRKEVLKSLIVFSLIKQSRQQGTYHAPLLVVLVNSISTEDSDLMLFFEQLKVLAQDELSDTLLKRAQEELIDDFEKKKDYTVGEGVLNTNTLIGQLEALTQEDLKKNVFNAQSKGGLELWEGETGKEIILRLKNAEKPFALIKVGDAKAFKDNLLEKLRLPVAKSWDEDREVFTKLNSEEKTHYNLLIGSRTFHEGWDSSRPNVINMINIGKKGAQKYIPQALGRGLRIQPNPQKPSERKRTGANPLIETLFVFATDKASVEGIIHGIKTKVTKEVSIPPLQRNKPYFDLLIPMFKDADETKKKISLFNISKETLWAFGSYVSRFDDSTLLLNHSISNDTLNTIRDALGNKGDVFQLNDSNNYNNMNQLFDTLANHMGVREKTVDKVDTLQEDTIAHFKHIKVAEWSEEDTEVLKAKIKKEPTKEEIETLKKFALYPIPVYNVCIEWLLKQHYYSPVLYQKGERNKSYIKHVMKHQSEVNFIKQLAAHEHSASKAWMFSKIDEHIDKISIPYYDGEQNSYREFYPDFIFWIKRENEYKIIFADPKGTAHTSYAKKIAAFESLFRNGKKNKTFHYKSYDVTFDLKLITEDENKVRETRYSEYWVNHDKFFLEICNTN